MQSLEKPRELVIGQVLSAGFDIVKSNLGLFIGAFLLAAIIPNIPSWICDAAAANMSGSAANGVRLIGKIADVVLKLLLQIGIVNISLKYYDTNSASIEDLFNRYQLLLSYLVSSFLYGLIVLVGMILLIVPGIMWAVQFQFFNYFIVDQGCGPIEALQKSSELTRGHRMKLFQLNLAQLGINLLGLLCLIIGMFFTAPATSVASAAAYRALGSKPSTSGASS